MSGLSRPSHICRRLGQFEGCDSAECSPCKVTRHASLARRRAVNLFSESWHVGNTPWGPGFFKSADL
eukprot:992462-Amphidinium_carterae.1